MTSALCPGTSVWWLEYIQRLSVGSTPQFIGRDNQLPVRASPPTDSALIQADLVPVPRLGLLGFLSFETDVLSGAATGNWGLMDQQSTMR